MRGRGLVLPRASFCTVHPERSVRVWVLGTALLEALLEAGVSRLQLRGCKQESGFVRSLITVGQGRTPLIDKKRNRLDVRKKLFAQRALRPCSEL